MVDKFKAAENLDFEETMFNFFEQKSNFYDFIELRYKSHYYCEECNSPIERENIFSTITRAKYDYSVQGSINKFCSVIECSCRKTYIEPIGLTLDFVNLPKIIIFNVMITGLFNAYEAILEFNSDVYDRNAKFEINDIIKIDQTSYKIVSGIYYNCEHFIMLIYIDELLYLYDGLNKNGEFKLLKNMKLVSKYEKFLLQKLIYCIVED
jgi:hypothetical protein